jgi:demethylmenaquinone methyltransferase / 2-methoxy-6-polyprenyl-1,4-benzoquinol methylase
MQTSEKRDEISGMFDRIAWRYDFLNHFLSFGTDKRWRRRAVAAIGRLKRPVHILDVATGTADLAIEALRLGPDKVTGADISPGMLQEGRKKIMKMGLAEKIELVLAPSEELPFPDGTFDVAMAAFGVRNFADTAAGLSEMYRVLSDDGVIMVLEFSKPDRFPVKQLYGFYFRRLLPMMGRLFSRDRSAYTYLPASVGSFPEGEAFLNLLGAAGFGSPEMKRLSGGIATIYTGRKTAITIKS